MNTKLSPVWGSVLLATILWGLMFAPGLHIANFWILMTLSASILGGGAIWLEKSEIFKSSQSRPVIRTIIWGVGSAAFLYTIFTVGDMITSLWSFQDAKVWAVYSTREEAPGWLIASLLVIIGSGEELFWRGFVQKRLTNRYSFNQGYLVATLLYTFVHINSLNPVLILAALVAGLFWGLLYQATGSIKVCIISHVVWDVMIFVVMPLR